MGVLSHLRYVVLVVLHADGDECIVFGFGLFHDCCLLEEDLRHLC